jgi:hypothetical protein
LCADLRREQPARCNFPRSPMSAASLPVPFDVAIAGDTLFELPAVWQNCNDEPPSVGALGGRKRCGQDGG